MKAKSFRTFLDRCSKHVSRLIGVRTSNPPLGSERALEMLLHAYNYVRALDLEGTRSAADLLLRNYKELKRNQQQCNRGYEPAKTA